jgi:hypothetical protein
VNLGDSRVKHSLLTRARSIAVIHFVAQEAKLSQNLSEPFLYCVADENYCADDGRHRYPLLGMTHLFAPGLGGALGLCGVGFVASIRRNTSSSRFSRSVSGMATPPTPAQFYEAL